MPLAAIFVPGHTPLPHPLSGTAGKINSYRPNTRRISGRVHDRESDCAHDRASDYAHRKVHLRLCTVTGQVGRLIASGAQQIIRLCTWQIIRLCTAENQNFRYSKNQTIHMPNSQILVKAENLYMNIRCRNYQPKIHTAAHYKFHGTSASLLIS